MRRLPNRLHIHGVAAMLALAFVGTQAQAARSAKSVETGQCFYLNQIQGQAVLDDRTVLFRVNVKDVYRLDFAQQCPGLRYPQPKLIITPFGGIGLVCHAIDLDVKVGDQGPGGFATACITKSLRRLTPEEVSAIPKAKLP